MVTRGPSGRIVLEIDPATKRRLYARLTKEGRTLRDWFMEKVSEHLAKPLEPPREDVEPSQAPDDTGQA